MVPCSAYDRPRPANSKGPLTEPSELPGLIHPGHIYLNVFLFPCHYKRVLFGGKGAEQIFVRRQRRRTNFCSAAKAPNKNLFGGLAAEQIFVRRLGRRRIFCSAARARKTMIFLCFSAFQKIYKKMNFRA